MERAVFRSLMAVPPSSLYTYRSVGPVCLYVHSEMCKACSEFAERKSDFEGKNFPKTSIVPFSVEEGVNMDLALRAGVEAIPAYVVIPRKGKFSIVTP